MRKLGEREVLWAILGGAFLAGGGGGSVQEGMRNAKLALELGDLYLASVEEISGEVLTSSIVGAPSAGIQEVKARHMVRSLEIFLERWKIEIGGIISCENGGTSTTNGWVQASFFGLPVVDAPADGRAHPTGVMGSMRLNKIEGYVSKQAACGGAGERYLEICVEGNLEDTSRLVREASVLAGGLISVMRNPVPPEYLRENAAVGGISLAIRIGKILEERRGEIEGAVEKISEEIPATLISVGKVEEVFLRASGGFDVGEIRIASEEGRRYEISFWNEYMTLEEGGRRIATFPDLIVTFDLNSWKPLTSAEIKKGDEVAIICAKKEGILLGSGVTLPEELRKIEEATGKEIVKFL